MRRATLVAALVFACAAARAERLAIHLSGSAQPDCWNLQEIVARVTAGAANDREKALALHRFGMAHFIHFNGPIEERGEYVTDPMKLLNVYGYALCGNNSCAMSALYNAAGLRARTLSLPGHSVPEVWFEGRWNYLDTDMFGYVFHPDGHTIASVDELARNAGWFLEQKNPPEPYYPYDEKTAMAGVFRNAVNHKNYHPYSNAHMMNLGLRTGENITFYYRPRGRFLLTEIPRNLGVLYKDYWTTGAVRRGSLAWRDEGPAAYGNALVEYAPDLRSTAFLAENQAEGVQVRRERQAPPLAAAAGKTASLVVEVNTPWVIVGMQNDLTDFADNTDAAVVSGLFWRASDADQNRILVSTDAGRTWKKVWENRYLGAVPFQVDLTRAVENRFDYRVKFEWTDSQGSGRVGLEALKLRTWLAVSPMGLPRLNAGNNSFRISTGARRTYYHESYWHRGEGLRGERLENISLREKAPYLAPADAGRPGVLIFPLGPRGDVEEVRISVKARALEGTQAVALALSLSEDNGGSWKELERFQPDPGHQMNHMWFNHAIRGRLLDGARALLRLEIAGGGLEKVIANSALRSTPAAASTLHLTHAWREGNQRKTARAVLPPGSAETRYEAAAGKGLINDWLRLECR
jgi:hypothetical protein